MNARLRAVEDRVARDCIPVGADVDAVGGRRAKDFIARNGNAVTKGTCGIGNQRDRIVAVPQCIARDRDSGAFRGVVEQNIG